MTVRHRVQPLPGAYLDLFPGWLPSAEATTSLTGLLAEMEWEQRSVRLFGKDVPQPRLIAWAATHSYRYSGLTLAPRTYPPTLQVISDAVRDHCRVPFNHVLLNRYRDGNDHMGWHSDDEPELGNEPSVACLSLGATRDLLFKQRRHSKEITTVPLSHGDLLLMHGSVQHTLVHRLPPRRKVEGERVSLTFRYVR